MYLRITVSGLQRKFLTWITPKWIIQGVCILRIPNKITDLIKKKRFKWFGHVVYKDNVTYIKYSYKSKFSNKKSRDNHQSKSNLINKDKKLPLQITERSAKDRVKWRSCVDKICSKLLWGVHVYNKDINNHICNHVTITTLSHLNMIAISINVH